jgi:hypothetical protein
MITANLVTIVGTAIVTIGGLIPVFKLHAKSIGKAIMNNAQPIATVVNHSVQVAEDIAKLPALAEAKVKLAEKEASFKNSELGRVAGAALHAYEKGFNSLSPNEKATLVTLVRVELSKANIDVSDQEIIAALTDAQRFADVFKSTEAFRNTVALENSLKALTQAVQNQAAAAPVQTA